MTVWNPVLLCDLSVLWLSAHADTIRSPHILAPCPITRNASSPPPSTLSHPPGLWAPNTGTEMLITVQMLHETGSPYPPALPPPLLPKPSKDNLRLQKLLRKAAKKKASVTTLQTSSFRASLSPVSEASHDQDAVPQPHPETPGAAAPPPLAPPILPSPLALPSPPRILVPAARSPYKPVIQHVASPLQKKSFSFNLSEQRSLAEHLRRTTPYLGGPGPDTPKPPGSSAPVSAPREVTHVSRVQVHMRQVLSPQSPTPAVNLAMGKGGHGKRDTTRTEPQEWPGDQEQEENAHQPSPQLPGAHIQPLIPNAQATSPCPEPPPAPRLSPCVEAAVAKQVVTKIVVPIAPTCRSPGLSQHSPLPRIPSAKAEPPKLSTGSHKVAAASDPKQQLPGPSSPSRASSPEPPRDTLVSSVLSPAPDGEVPKAAPAPTPRTRFSGWTRLKKQLIVAPEAPSFPEPEGAEVQPEQASREPREPAAGPAAPRPPGSRATRMWDAVLYRMSVAKGGNQTENTKEAARAPPGGLLGRNSFLPFLYRPRFDARKLREMATQPPAKVNTVLGVSMRPSLAPKNFNRTAACWQLK
ncbi:proline-rich protein 33 [Phascolarctos cinereus]